MTDSDTLGPMLGRALQPPAWTSWSPSLNSTSSNCSRSSTGNLHSGMFRSLARRRGSGCAPVRFWGGRQPALLMQNAGLLNSCNALTTTALQFEIPMLLVVWYAGDFGDTAFMRLGEVTEGVLDGLGIRYHLPRSLDELQQDVIRAKRLADYAKRPVVVLVSRYARAEVA